jgi:hypothetical protein
MRVVRFQLPCPSRYHFVALLVLLSPVISPAQDSIAVIRDWLPTRPGDRWIYETEMLDGDKKHPDVTRWEQEDTIFATQTIPEGVLVRRKVRFLNNTAPPYPPPDSEANILIHNRCIYYLHDSFSDGGYGWDSSRKELTASFKKDLAISKALPDVCFPIHIGQTWGNPKIGRDLWTVAGLGKKTHDDPVSVTMKSWRLEASLASGDGDYVWFQKGVGIVAERTYHNGTYSDYQVRLLKFEPGSSGR